MIHVWREGGDGLAHKHGQAGAISKHGKEEEETDDYMSLDRWRVPSNLQRYKIYFTSFLAFILSSVDLDFLMAMS